MPLGPPHTSAFFMRCVAFRHHPSMHIHGRIVTERNATREKRTRVGPGALNALVLAAAGLTKRRQETRPNNRRSQMNEPYTSTHGDK